MLEKLKVIETGKARYQPDKEYTYNHNLRYLANQQWLASLIGTIALVMPAILFFSTIFAEICFHHSISHFYYAPFWGDFMIGSLAFLAALLITYRGETPKEGRLATSAGLAVIGIALFPAEGTGCVEQSFSARVFAEITQSKIDVLQISEVENSLERFELAAFSQKLHLFMGGLLFLILAVYSWQVLTRPVNDQNIEPSENQTKKARNAIYRNAAAVTICAVLFLSGSIWAEPKSWNQNQSTFWFEYLALGMFGISWLVKGRVWGTMYMDPRDEDAWAILRAD